MMNRLLTVVGVLGLLMVGTSAYAQNEYDQDYRRPIDNWTGNFFDHSYTWSYMSGVGGYSDGWISEDHFKNAGSDCASSPWSTGAATSSNCTSPNASWENYGQLWGVQCADANASQSYGIWGVCHQSTANVMWYAYGSPGNLPNDARGWGWSSGLYGTWGTDGGGRCY
jgi:hypothetical protein